MSIKHRSSPWVAAAGARASRPRPAQNSPPLEGCPKGGVVASPPIKPRQRPRSRHCEE
jgi:hypothetical protein